jgi:hypothetical protein
MEPRKPGPRTTELVLYEFSKPGFIFGRGGGIISAGMILFSYLHDAVSEFSVVVLRFEAGTT